MDVPESGDLTRSPSEYFIRYCLTKDQESEPAQVVSSLARAAHVLPDEPVQYVLRLSAELEERMPDPFRPHDLRHAASQLFLHRERVWHMWHPNRVVLDAVRVHDQPLLREQARSMLAAGFNHGAVVSLLSHGMNEVLLEDSIRLFEHYFWNMGLFTVLERERLFLHGRAGPVALRAYLAGSHLSGKSRVMDMFGHKVTSVDERRVMNDSMIRAHQLLSRVDEERDVLRQAQAFATYVATIIQAGRRGDEVGGALASQAEHMSIVRTPTVTFTNAQLLAPGGERPHLPGRAHLRVVEDAQVVGPAREEGAGGDNTSG